MSPVFEKCFISVFLTSLLLLSSLAIFGCRKFPQKTEVSLDQNDYTVREGNRLFLHFCSPCHGEDAAGAGRYFPSQINPQPPDLVNSSYLRETPRSRVFQAIKFGTQAVGQSPYSPPYSRTLRDEEIDDIINSLLFSAGQAEESPGEAKNNAQR